MMAKNENALKNDLLVLCFANGIELPKHFRFQSKIFIKSSLKSGLQTNIK